MKIKSIIGGVIIASSILGTATANAGDSVELLNVSYDPTREFYQDYNKIFAEHWKESTGQDINVHQSHGGSGAQARSVIDGLQADIVTLALSYDIDAIAERAKLLPSDWQSKLPNNSAPYTSTIVFLVKKGNPKNIKDWNDLIKPGISVITPNPKTSGGARWNFLAAWSYGIQQSNGDEAAATDFIRKLYKNVPVLDSGARGSTITFTLNGVGDVLLAWENEAYYAVNELGKDKYEIVYPPTSILAEPPVAIVEENAKKHGTLEASKEYLAYLYSSKAQQLIANHYFRPSDMKVVIQNQFRFPQVKFSKISDFGGWAAAQKKFFDDGALFDQLYQPVKQVSSINTNPLLNWD